MEQILAAILTVMFVWLIRIEQRLSRIEERLEKIRLENRNETRRILPY